MMIDNHNDIDTDILTIILPMKTKCEISSMMSSDGNNNNNHIAQQ